MIASQCLEGKSILVRLERQISLQYMVSITVGSNHILMFYTGSKPEMVNKMNLFYKGKFTPFEGKVLLYWLLASLKTLVITTSEIFVVYVQFTSLT